MLWGFSIGALIFTYTILVAPYYNYCNYSIMCPKTLCASTSSSQQPTIGRTARQAQRQQTSKGAQFDESASDPDMASEVHVNKRREEVDRILGPRALGYGKNFLLILNFPNAVYNVQTLEKRKKALCLLWCIPTRPQPNLRRKSVKRPSSW